MSTVDDSVNRWVRAFSSFAVRFPSMKQTRRTRSCKSQTTAKLYHYLSFQFTVHWFYWHWYYYQHYLNPHYNSTSWLSQTHTRLLYDHYSQLPLLTIGYSIGLENNHTHQMWTNFSPCRATYNARKYALGAVHSVSCCCMWAISCASSESHCRLVKCTDRLRVGWELLYVHPRFTDHWRSIFYCTDALHDKINSVKNLKYRKQWPYLLTYGNIN